jgi:hypothetical protein
MGKLSAQLFSSFWVNVKNTTRTGWYPMSVEDSKQKGLAARLAIWTGSLLVLAGFIDALVSVVTKTESLTCLSGIALPWCAEKTGGRTIADFAGDWTNSNPKTSGITRIAISQALDKAVVRAWGSCVPKECDVGTAETAASHADSGALQVEWNSGFDTKQATLTIGEGGRLEVRVKTHFKDNSGRPDYEFVDYFKRP